MSYHVKEIYYTLQGEGANAGRPAVFCRFTGCNLWSGREQDRSTAVCNFCDTDFVGTDGPGGGIFADCDSLASAIDSHWPVAPSRLVQKLVVCTGGEPLLQLDSALVQALHRAKFLIAVETNGTRIPPDGIDWLCVSPKEKSGVSNSNRARVKACLSATQCETRRLRTFEFRPLFSSNPWMAPM